MDVGDPVESTPDLDPEWRKTGVVVWVGPAGRYGRLIEVRITGAARHSDGAAADPADPWRRTGAVTRSAAKLWRPLNAASHPSVEHAMATRTETPNTTMPNGTEVAVTRDDGSTWLTRTRTEPWQLGDGTWVVALEGRAGGYLLDRVRRRTASDG